MPLLSWRPFPQLLSFKLSWKKLIRRCLSISISIEACFLQRFYYKEACICVFAAEYFYNIVLGGGGVVVKTFDLTFPDSNLKEISLKMGQSRRLFRLFSTFQTNTTMFTTHIYEKMSMQYTVLGFEPTTFSTWVFSKTTRPGLPPCENSWCLMFLTGNFALRLRSYVQKTSSFRTNHLSTMWRDLKWAEIGLICPILRHH